MSLPLLDSLGVGIDVGDGLDSGVAVGGGVLMVTSELTGKGVGVDVGVGARAVVGAGVTVAVAAGRAVGVGVGPPQAIARTVKIIRPPARVQALFTLSPVSVGETAEIHEGLYARLLSRVNSNGVGSPPPSSPLPGLLDCFIGQVQALGGPSRTFRSSGSWVPTGWSTVTGSPA